MIAKAEALKNDSLKIVSDKYDAFIKIYTK